MAAGNYDFPPIYKGTTWGPYVFTCKDGNGDPVDLTGYSAFAEARLHPSGCLAFDLAPEITDAAGGEITFEFDKDETNTKPVGNFGWDLVLENAAGERKGPYAIGVVPVLQPKTEL